uniref:Reverse transcriptase domain-containing protein n=2 Tax=Aegilops tauschii subsp. strangulata TaxID=200361 RepID=A0A453EC58_AEGTS
MEEINKALADLTAAISGMSAQISEIHPVVLELQGWRPAIERSVDELRAEVTDLRQHIQAPRPAAAQAPDPALLKETAPSVRLSDLPPLLPDMAGTSLHRPGEQPHARGDGSHGPDGRGVAHDLRGKSVGEIHSPRLPPATGPYDLLPYGEQSFSGDWGYHRLPPPPRFDFPVFDGTNPKAWRLKCEAYFRVCTLSPDTWVSCAAMYFTDGALTWLQSSQAHLHYQDWGGFAAAICAQFGREEFQNLLRQFNRLKQTSTVAEYAEQFTQIMHHLLAHHPSWDPAFFVTQFMEGLQRDIRAAVVLHRPQTLDTVVDLAFLQEEVVDSFRRDDRRHSSPPSLPAVGRATPRTALPLPLPPPKPGVGVPDARREGRRDNDNNNKSTSNEDKLAALRAYRRAKGLCFTCGERWSREHRCGPTVQLHVVEELIEMLQGQPTEQEQKETAPSEADCCVLSKEALEGAESPTTMRLHGWVQDREVLMLVDSGSSHSFVSSTLAHHLQGVQSARRPLSVRVANGGVLRSDLEISKCEWRSQGVKFATDMKVLPLGCYDVILGIDWLACHSPMRVHWLEKTMDFQRNGVPVHLCGARADVTRCDLISGAELHHLLEEKAVTRVVQLCATAQDMKQPPLPEAIGNLIEQYGVLFEEPKGLPPQRAFDHSIPLVPGARPVNLRPYRHSPAQKDEVERQVAEMLAQGIIQPSVSPFASPVLLVQKKDLTWRFCVDYRHLNAVTIKNRYPLPVIEELLDELAGSRLFTSLDLRAGYHQIRMRPEDEHKTAFKTHHGHFEFKVMPYGVTGGPSTFQGGMNIVLSPLLRKGVLVFIDDILIHSEDEDSHLSLLQQVFQLLQKHSLKVKLSKCSFAQPKLVYLGHEISGDGVRTDHKNILAVQQWPVPSNIKEVRGFLGLAGYYRKFVRGFAVTSRPLTDLLKKGVVFRWTYLEDGAFRALQQALVTAPVLALPNFTKTFELETDALDQGIGAVLSQNGHPIGYLSRALGPRNRLLSTYEKEGLAILMAVDHWRTYLQNDEFIVHTDQRSLIHLEDQRLATPWQQKIMAKLLGLRYRIVYKKGVDNRAADALSRVPRPPQGDLAAITTAVPAWLEAVQQGYDGDPAAQRLLARLATQQGNLDGYTLQEGIIRQHGRIWLGDNVDLQKQVLDALHTGAIGSHSGFNATYRQVRRLFTWPGLKHHVKLFVEACQICKQAKPERFRYPGLLEPLPVPTQAWQMITMDFVEGLPRSSGCNSILVVVDKFSRYAHFIALSHPFTAFQVAQAFVAHIYK